MAGYRATDNYYRHERDTYRTAYDIRLKDEEVSGILKKLCKHYGGSGVFKIKFYGTRDSGSAGYGNLRLSHEPSMGLLIHEFGHLAKSLPGMQVILKNVSHKGTSHHGLRFQTCISRIHDWAKNKNYWQDELMKKREKKKNKIEQVKVEIKEIEANKDDPKYTLNSKIDKIKKEILKKELAIKRYEKKLKYFQKLYSTKTKKAHRSIGALNRALKKYESEVEVNILCQQ